MIKIEYLRDDTLVKHYSDKGVMLIQVETGMKYADPVDVVPCRYTYEETDEPIENQEESEEKDETAEKAMAYDIIVGSEE